MLYEAYQAQRDVTAPVRAMATLAVRLLEGLPAPMAELPAVRLAAAANEMVARSALTHARPEFGIDRVGSGNHAVAVREVVVDRTAFGSLIHFTKDGDVAQPKVLVVAALAGHFSTLLRSTVASLLCDHDVYLTDWHNARDIPLDEGGFGFDDYVEHIMRFLGAMGPGGHVVAVCQPCPAVLAAASVMAEAKDPAVPRSLTLMAGPIDGRVNPTVVNALALDRPLSWFEDHVVTTVPWRYAGAGRRVYPGFLQLAGFVSMNWENHVDQHLDMFHHLVSGDRERAAASKDFYDEYCAVLDLPAEFYLETVDRVFQRFLLPRGELEYRGRAVHPAALTRTALLTVEGERDDICGVGQTMAAQELCSGVPRQRRHHHLQAGVGHYGVFSGTTWERRIYPVVRDFVLASS